MINELINAVNEAWNEVWVEISFTLLIMSALAAACILAAPDKKRDESE